MFTLHANATASAVASKGQDKALKIGVIVCGLPGAMGKEIAAACAKRPNCFVAPVGLTGPGMPSEVDLGAPIGRVELIDGKAPDAKTRLEKALKPLRKKYDSVIAIDFTHPSAVNSNAQIYNDLRLPFVMGTTGGDREELLRSTAAAKNHAVISPNMAKQVVAFQMMMDYMAQNFPGSFKGYTLEVVESHQKTKADTSGTAKAVVDSLNHLMGTTSPEAQFAEESIKKLRTDKDSMDFGVPKEYLSGHAHHTYRLTSQDKTVAFEFQHDINGRSVYALGVADAVVFLAHKIAEQRAQPRIWTMADVLKSGSML